VRVNETEGTSEWGSWGSTSIKRTVADGSTISRALWPSSLRQQTVSMGWSSRPSSCAMSDVPLMRAQGRTYTDEFRAEAVALYRRTDRSVTKVADDLGVNHWLKRDAMKQKKRAPRPTTPPANETAEQKVVRLERELEKRSPSGEQRNPENGGGLLRDGKRVKLSFIHAEKAVSGVIVLNKDAVLGRSFLFWASPNWT